MKESMINTPLTMASNASKKLGVNLYIKRDDLYPSFGGGNKARKMSYIIKDILKSNPDIVITNGGAESNHARVCALMASYYNMKAHLVLHGNETAQCNSAGNFSLIKAVSSYFTFVSPELISTTIDGLVEQYSKQGLQAFVIPGGAHSPAGTKAYFDAIDELPFEPDYIILPSGTGATHAGIQAAVNEKKWKTKVFGISVARNKQRGEKVVFDTIKEFESLYKLNSSANSENVLFLDDWISGGYEKFDDSVVDAIKFLLKHEGIILDPTYTGKAFLGLSELIKSKIIKNEASVVFWHTGGIFNLSSSKALLI